jgi:hypothetical protein
MLKYDLENTFRYHAPKADQPAKYEALRAKAKELAALILESVPDSRERSIALTKVEEASMWSNAGIARN